MSKTRLIIQNATALLFAWAVTVSQALTSVLEKLSLPRGVRAILAAITNGRLLPRRPFQPLSALLLITAIAFSSAPSVVTGQANNSKGKIDPKLVLSPDKMWSLIKKFSGKFGKPGATEKGSQKEPANFAIEGPPSGRYRVWIVGFICEHETRDDLLATDGLADEIRLNVETLVVDRESEVLLHGSTQSRVMGSVNSDEWRRTRIQAGSADRFGGIRTGDHVPSQPAYAPVFDPRSGAPADLELPLLLFEGDLVQGLSSVIIVPTMWEIDGGAGLFPRFQRAIAEALPAIIRAGATLAGGPATGAVVGPAAEAGIGALDHLITGIRGGDGGDRLIGIHRNGDQDVFAPNVVRLNYDTAELALRTRIGPFPPGTLPMVYRDDGDLNGNYTLFVKIERITPPGPPPG